MRHGDPLHRPIAHRVYTQLYERRGEWGKRHRGHRAAGDCLAPRYLADAIFDGHRIARELNPPIPSGPRP